MIIFQYQITKIMKTKILFSALIISLFAISCNKSQSDKFDYGHFENGKYTNSFFGLEMEIPTDWQVLSQEQNVNLMNNSEQMVDEDNKALQQAVETSKITTAILLTASQYGLEVSDSIFNPNIMFLAENLEGTDKVKSPSDYLLITRSALQQDPSPKEYPFSSFLVININGTDFAQMRVVNKSTENQSYTQDYYVSLHKNFALSFILTYGSEIQRIALEQALNTLVITPSK